MNSSDRRAPIRYILIIVGFAGAAVLAARAFLIRRAPRQTLSGIPSAADSALPLPTLKNIPLTPVPAASFIRPHPRWQRWLIAHRVGLMLIPITLLGVGLGVVFAITGNNMNVWGDGFDYWGLIQTTRASICEATGWCTHSGMTAYTFMGLLREVAFNRQGVMPALFGALLVVLPNEYSTIHFLHILMMGISSALMSHLLLRLKFPFWTAVLAGVFNVCYIPAVTNTVNIFQQPFIRFVIVLSIWSYAIVLTSTKRRTVWMMSGVGAFAVFLLGFSGFTTRPLLWVMPIGIILCSALDHNRRIRLPALIAFLLIQIGALMWLYQYTLSQSINPDPTNISTILLIGISPDQNSNYLTTVRSFEDFWPPSEWGIQSVPSRTQTLWQDFTSAPLDFVQRFNFSLFSNWRYPDHTFLKTFILSPSSQHTQHTLMLILGALGIMFWSGLRDNGRILLFMILAVGGFLSVAYAIISVEPRRISVLMPFVIAAAAVGVYAFRGQPKHYRGQVLGLMLLTIGVWMLPLGVVKLLFPINAAGALIGLVIIRFGLVFIVGERLLRGWKQQQPKFRLLFSRLILSFTLIVLVLAQFQDQDWRMWNASINTAVQQKADVLQPIDGFFPWLLIDNDSYSMLRETQILINGEILKPADTPMRIWEAGPSGMWPPYVDLLLTSHFPPRRMWYAYPIPEALISTQPLTITLETQGVPIVLRGDYANGDQGAFDGPSFEPWMSGHSFWRWQWNGDDPRIPMLQTLNGHYTSSILEGDQWLTGDLSSEIGRQDGVYRIFVVWSPIGPETNAIAGPGQRFYNVVVCPDGWAVQMGLVSCKESEGAVSFYAEGGLVGTAPASVFQPMIEPNKHLYQIKGALGRVDVFQVMNYTYLANYYLPSGEFYYSLVFEKPPS